jgi:hypothetical protein
MGDLGETDIVVLRIANRDPAGRLLKDRIQTGQFTESVWVFADIGLDGKSFPVSKKSCFELFEHHHELFTATSYTGQNSVPRYIFEKFANSLKRFEKLEKPVGRTTDSASRSKPFSLSKRHAVLRALSTENSPVASFSERDTLRSRMTGRSGSQNEPRPFSAA